jgi:hypothetical protein
VIAVFDNRRQADDAVRKLIAGAAGRRHPQRAGRLTLTC